MSTTGRGTGGGAFGVGELGSGLVKSISFRQLDGQKEARHAAEKPHDEHHRAALDR